MMFLYYVLIHETRDLKEDALPLSHDCICEPLVVMCSVASITASFKPRLSQFSTLYLLLIKHWYPESPPPGLGPFKHIQETPLCSSTNQALTDLMSLLHWHVSVEQVLTCFFWVLFWKDFWVKKGRGLKNTTAPIRVPFRPGSFTSLWITEQVEQASWAFVILAAGHDNTHTDTQSCRGATPDTCFPL